MRSHKITQNSQSINLDIQTRLIVQLNQQTERSVPMDEKIKNWLHYGERSITSKDVRGDCLLFGLFSLCYDLFRYNKLTITLTDLLLLSGILFTGMKARGKTATKEVFLFKGLCGMCMTYRFYSLALLFSTLSGANPVHCALLYGAIFLMITFLLFRYVKKRIAANGYAAEYRTPMKTAPLIGAMLGTSLSPLLFQNITQDGEMNLLAIGFLFLGTMYQFSTNYVLKYLATIKYENDLPQA